MALSEEERRERNNASARAYKKRTGYAANKRSQKKNLKMYSLGLSYSTDGDLITYLDSLENRNGYLRELIRSDMEGTRVSAVQEHRTRIIPFFGNSFAAGVGEPDFGNALEEYEIHEEQRGDFAVRINGDSMEPWLPDGSIQLGIRGTPQDGDVAAIMVDGAFYVKQVCVDAYGNLHLFSLNRARRDLDFDVWASGGNNVLCFGTIIMPEKRPLPLD